MVRERNTLIRQPSADTFPKGEGKKVVRERNTPTGRRAATSPGGGGYKELFYENC